MSMEFDSEQIAGLIPLETDNQKLAQQIIEEKDIDKAQELVKLFNLNQCKKNALRLIKLNNLYDKVSDQMIERFEKRPGEFTNTDLLNYLNTTQNAIDKASKALNLIDETPAITLNQVNIGVSENTLDSESRTKVLNAVNSILQKIKQKEEQPQEDKKLLEETIQDDEEKFQIKDYSIKENEDETNN